MFSSKKAIVENNSTDIKKKKEHQKYLHYIFISIIIVFIILSVINISIDMKLAIIAIVLGLIAIYITIRIAKKQDEQLDEIQVIGSETKIIGSETKVIGSETKEIAKKLRIDAKIQENIKNFFPLKDTGKKYKLFFPIEYISKPLPIVNQGDFYAIHVLSTRLGSDNLEMRPIEKNLDIKKVDFKGDAILMCAPHANPVLKKLYDFKVINAEYNKDNTEIEEWLKKLDLPCWFVEEKGTNGWTTRKIWVQGNTKPLESDAEQYYQKAQNKTRIDKSDMDDYGIFARVNRDNNQYIIIAGIHQYGTWAIASLLSYLLAGEPVQYSKTFLSNEEFIAVIWGKFDEKNLTFDIKNIKVERNYIWTKVADKWISVPPSQ